MDSVISWLVLLLAAALGAFSLISKGESELRSNRAANDDFFRSHRS